LRSERSERLETISIALVTQTYTEATAEAASVLAEKTGIPRHDVALVMGSGWLPAVDALRENRGSEVKRRAQALAL